MSLMFEENHRYLLMDLEGKSQKLIKGIPQVKYGCLKKYIFNYLTSVTNSNVDIQLNT